MTTMTTVQVSEATARPILEFGRAWMVAPTTAAKAQELGLTGGPGRFGFWVNGRAGVLGEVDPSLAAAAIGFMDPGAVRGYWNARPESLAPWDVSLAWFGCGATWGREALAVMPDARVRRLSDLARKVIDGADVSIGGLFAGSALVPMPGDAAADATINLNVLREWRGAAHLAACHAAGLGPHATIMSTDDPVRGGVTWSETFGWQPPHPTPDPAGRARVEEMTTVAASRAFESLDSGERTEFIDLVVAAHACIG